MNPTASDRQETAIDASDFIVDVRRGLAGEPKTLPAKYLYDDVGSALFEVITRLPEYGLTRADNRLIERHTPDLLQFLAPSVLVAELGSGNGTKTRRVLSALAARGPLEYLPIDISVGALERCQSELGDIEDLTISPIASGYLDGLRDVVDDASVGTQLLLLFLGSTIGNFERPFALEFLTSLRRELRTGDVLLLGTDLEKPAEELLAAYDDPLGVTAAFNLNVLVRINRELRGNFDPTGFAHEARYDRRHRRVEMHLRALRNQVVRIEAADIEVTFTEDETIWTESSHKFDCLEVRRMAEGCGFRCAAQWVDRDWPFAENVLIAE